MANRRTGGAPAEHVADAGPHRGHLLRWDWRRPGAMVHCSDCEGPLGIEAVAKAWPAVVPWTIFGQGGSHRHHRLYRSLAEDLYCVDCCEWLGGAEVRRAWPAAAIRGRENELTRASRSPGDSGAHA